MISVCGEEEGDPDAIQGWMRLIHRGNVRGLGTLEILEGLDQEKESCFPLGQQVL
jgi:hypothetical protein